MKQYLSFVLFAALFGGLNAQIQYSGCNSSIAAGYPITLNHIGDDGSRNIYANTLPGTPCSAGSCVFRVVWVNNQWEVQLSTNGGASFPNVLYVNTVASLPNPPDLTLGTWSGQGSCSGQNLQIFSGDVQSDETLSISNHDNLKGLVLRPNPASTILNIKMSGNLKQATIYSLLGEEILKETSSVINTSNLKTGVYLIKIENEKGLNTTKRFIKQ